MQMIAILLLSLFSLSTFAQSNAEKLAALHTIKRIHLGSCNNQKDAQPLWKDMMKREPDLFIWGGDNIYADWEKISSIEEGYRLQNSHPDYAEFKSRTPIIGTWDDHDYGMNNAGGNYNMKRESQRLMLDFFEEPENSPRRSQEGIYTSYDFGSAGRRIKFILLDNRYFKDLDPNAPMLGEAQWLWLEKELKNSKAQLHFISSGLTVFGPFIPFSEGFPRHYQEQKRMQALLTKYKPQGVVFISGDKHFSAINMGWGQLEFMSSGMTHKLESRIARMYSGRKYAASYFGISYGQIDIDWDGSIPLLKMAMRTPQGGEIHPTRFRWKKDAWVYSR